jgi:hypothetical protein
MSSAVTKATSCRRYVHLLVKSGVDISTLHLSDPPIGFSQHTVLLIADEFLLSCCTCHIENDSSSTIKRHSEDAAAPPHSDLQRSSYRE